MVDEFNSAQKVPERVDLRARYPQSFRVVFYKSFWFLLAAALVIFSYFYLLTSSVDFSSDAGTTDRMSSNVHHFLLWATLICLGIKFCYELIHDMTFAYGVEMEHITITRGVIMRARGSFPIAKVTDVTVNRNFIEMLFGLYTLDMLTASPLAKTGFIDGLSLSNAAGLQEFILALVETTTPDVKEKAVETILENSLEGEEADKLMHAK